MSIEKILSRIEEEAESAARELIREAEAEGMRLKDLQAEEAEELSKQLEQQVSRKAEEEQRRLIANEQLELRKLLLEKKREILDEMYDLATERISSLGEKDYLDLIREMILRRSISGGEEIIVPKAQKKLFEGDFLDSLNKEWKGGGRFTIAEEPGDFSWGVVLREGKRVVNLSLGVLMDLLRDRIEAEIAPVLFPSV
jgi:V/A-type H+-transporting ATPase subunit E